MTATFSPTWLARGLLGVGVLLIFGCDVPVNYGPGPAGGYYEPYGYDYGAWGPGFTVAPYRRNFGFAGGYRGFHGAHAFRGAPPGRGVPSLPGGRPGGGRGGGGRGGGGERGGSGGHSAGGSRGGR